MLIDEATSSLRTGNPIIACSSSRADLVDARIGPDLVHALPDADLRGEVNHGIGALQATRYASLVAHVTERQFDAGPQIGRPLLRAMDLRIQVVEHWTVWPQSISSSARWEPMNPVSRDDDMHEASPRRPTSSSLVAFPSPTPVEPWRPEPLEAALVEGNRAYSVQAPRLGY